MGTPGRWEPTPGARAVDRAAWLLRLIAAAEKPLTFTQLLSRTCLPRSTQSRLLLALERNELIIRGSGWEYQLGPVLTGEGDRLMPGSIQFYADLGMEDRFEPLATVDLPDFQAAVMADIPAGSARVVVTAQAPPDVSQKNRIAGLADQLAAIGAALPEDGIDQPYDRWTPEAVVLLRVYEALYGHRPWWAKDDEPR